MGLVPVLVAVAPRWTCERAEAALAGFAALL